jgi:purine-binding chemotaxis protein CheW
MAVQHRTQDSRGNFAGHSQVADPQSAASNQYLTFIMADEEYGVDILCVQEIRGWESATPLPKAPKHIKGVINLRGTIVPIVDLRQCFGMQGIEYTPITVVIVLKVQHERGSRVMGIVVDAVSDVYALSDSDMRAAPDLGDGTDTEFIKGLVTVNERMVILLNIDRLLTFDDLPDLTNLKEKLAEV